MTDNDGTLTETYTYDAFGTLTYIQSLNEEGVLAQTDTALSRFLYAGEQYDEVSGLYYLRARRYDTTVGRFTQEDTYLGDGRNLYVYVQNNPLKYVDPSGHDKKHERIGDGLFNFASGIIMALTGTAATIVATTLALTATVAGGPVLAVVGTVVMVATAAMGAGMAVMGVSDATQGAMEVYNAITGNPDPAPNLIRDTVFGGNQEAYIQAEAMLSFGTTIGLTMTFSLPLVITTSASGAISYYAKMDTSGSGSGTSGLEPGTLSNVDARKWYLEQEAKIPDLIDDSLPLEEQARQAFDLRNQYRTQARELMSDRQLAESLYTTDPNLTWEQIIQKQIDKGLAGDDIYKAIIESSQRSRTSVNQLLGLE